MNRIINRYLIVGFLKTITNVILAFLLLGIILSFFEEIEFFKNLNVGIKLPIVLTLMFLPNLVIKLLPFIIFIASMIYVISLRSNSDLVSLKVFGYSNLKIVSILSTTTFFLSIFIIFVINPVTASMIKYYETTKAKYSRDTDHLVSINKNGLWIKDIEDNKLRITTAKKIEENYLSDVTIYIINKNNKLTERIETKSINIESFDWAVKKATVYSFKNGPVEINEKENLILKSSYNVEKLKNIYKNLDTISFLSLITEYDQLLERGYTKKLLSEKLHFFMSLPFFLILMVVLASIFTIGTMNRKQNLYFVFISIITCATIYYFKDLSIALAQTNKMSLELSIWVPVIALSLFCSIGILQINEK
tara:strand:+ start:1832 stop:2920 length:1089 start_codon:yes stop_codon:yes gene_type:complete